MESNLRKFPNLPVRPVVTLGDGMYFHVEDGRRILDFTSGVTGGGVLGYSHPAIVTALKAQLEKITHIGYGVWSDPTLSELADLLVSKAPKGLDKVYFAGLSGSEAVEAAMKLSFQTHHDAGNVKKTWFICRRRGYHGATLQAMAVSDNPLFKIFRPMCPDTIRFIPAHDPIHDLTEGDSLDDYAKRGARELEKAILKIGPENVCAFVGETMLGAGGGYIPPANGYWRVIKGVCARHNIHLILDEVFCGLGRAGKLHCCQWDDVSPDFLCVGKTLGAGYAPLSAVLCNRNIETTIAHGPSGRIHHGHTYQGHTLGATAALAVQKIVHQNDTLIHISSMAQYLRQRLELIVSHNPYVQNLRGRGLLLAVDYTEHCRRNIGSQLQKILEEEYLIQVNARGPQLLLAPAFILSTENIDRLTDVLPEALERANAE